MPSDEPAQPSTHWAAELASASMAVARGAAAGGVLWCWSPTWPHHAEHVAVEFVHPVIVGTRALPAEAVVAPDPVAKLRATVAAGDMLIVIADGASHAAHDVLRRARAWGVESVWIGTGTRPQERVADHVVWVEGYDGSQSDHVQAFDGRVILAYHVLWEVTHVCFEHPGLLDLSSEPARDSERDTSSAPECVETSGHCTTCSDEATLGEVLQPSGPSSVMVRTPAGLEDVDASLVDPVAPGDLVLVHAGVAISRLEDRGL